ncbi:GDT1-like protein 5 isoform X2 [Pistacia vera]|uniref:GDT1-like protein 5 isoform X2 n=1 Tax=Pistacia vera TaxID=55513 RepID=UPI0012636990|nr:GDT1-like protein 5 isoform X2 [Pistacia vera]
MKGMNLSVLHGFTKSLAMTVLSEVGDRTFCVAAILAMRYPRRSVFLGCLFSVIVMTIISALIGWVAPNLISQKWAHHITAFLFFVFGIQSLWGGLTEDDDDNEELAEVEKELEDEDLKKQHRPVFTRFFTPVFLKAFSLTFFGEWGDKSQLATIGLAADENTLGVVLGGIIGQALCVVAAVLGGKTLASRISERLVTILGGALFLFLVSIVIVLLLPDALFPTLLILSAEKTTCALRLLIVKREIGYHSFLCCTKLPAFSESCVLWSSDCLS